MRLSICLIALALAAAVGASSARATTAQEQLADLSAQSGTAPESARGEQFFTSKHGLEWSCSSCHGPVPTTPGQHASTGKVIKPMAPACNPERFTDAVKSEKWFRRNCRDVVGRECSAAEKADVLAWLLTLKPSAQR